jgi:hypothetical protein
MTTKQASWKIGALMACLGLSASHLALANPPACSQRATIIRDVALREGGILHGSILDGTGRALPDTPVQVRRGDVVVATARTDARGHFAAPNLTGGVHQVTTPSGAAVYRLWTPGAAPPAAAQSALVLPEGGVVRGQAGGMSAWVAPAVSAAVIATAAGITVAIATGDDCPPAS